MYIVVGKAVISLPSATTNNNNNNSQGIKVNDDCRFKAIMYNRRTPNQQGYFPSIDSSLEGSLLEKVCFFIIIRSSINHQYVLYESAFLSLYP